MASTDNTGTILMIVPTYNELENIARLVSEIIKQPINADVLVVDDASPDQTGEAVKEIMRTEKRVHLLPRPGKLGLGTAYKDGIRYGLQHGFDFIGTMDADFSHNPKYLPAMFKASENADIVIGSRYVPNGGTVNWGVHRQILSGGANAFARFALGFRTHDNTAGFRLYRRELLEKINLDSIRSNGYSFLVEFLYRCQQQQARVTEVPIIFVDRRDGLSKISKQEIGKAIMTIFRLRFGG